MGKSVSHTATLRRICCALKKEKWLHQELEEIQEKKRLHAS
jgi:hypothetical protein